MPKMLPNCICLILVRRMVSNLMEKEPRNTRKTQKNGFMEKLLDGVGVCQASCRLFFKRSSKLYRTILSWPPTSNWGPISAMRELCYTVPYSNGYAACLSAVFSAFCCLNFFKVTVVPGSQFLVLPDHLSGCCDLAF